MTDKTNASTLTPKEAFLKDVAKSILTKDNWVPRINWDKYLGKHYEIAHSKNWFTKKGSFDITATYALNSSNEITVTNEAKYYNFWGSLVKDKAEAIAHKVPASDQRKRDVPIFDTNRLEVFFDPAHVLPGSYVIADYFEGLYAVVISDSHDYIWILSRKPWLEAEELFFIEKRINHLSNEVFDKKYNLDRLIYTGQDTAVVNKSDPNFSNVTEKWKKVISWHDDSSFFNYTRLFIAIEAFEWDKYYDNDLKTFEKYKKYIDTNKDHRLLPE